MPDLSLDPLLRTPLAAFAVALAAVGAIRLIGGAAWGSRLASAGLPLAALVAAAMAAGLPPLPPPADSGALPVLVLAGLAVGAVLDALALRVEVPRWAWRATGLAFGLAGAWWTGGAPLAPPGIATLALVLLPLAVLWLVPLWRLERAADEDRPAAPNAAVMLAAGAAGLALAGHAGGAPAGPDAALGLAAAALGYLAWNWPRQRYPFGAAATLGGGAAFACLAARLTFEAAVSPLAVAAVLLVFFADGVAPPLSRGPEPLRRALRPLTLFGLCAFPVGLAAAIAYVGARM